jgi:hypothetical protein
VLKGIVRAYMCVIIVFTVILSPKDRDHGEGLWTFDRTLVPARFVWVMGAITCLCLYVVGDESQTLRSMVVAGSLAVGLIFEVCKMIIRLPIGGDVLTTGAFPSHS